jgi:hypothetical protein
MENSKTLKEFVESLFESSRMPNKDNIYIEMADRSFWSIKLFEKSSNIVEITINNVVIGEFIKLESPIRGYKYEFIKNKRNLKNNMGLFTFLKNTFEDNNILCRR